MTSPNPVPSYDQAVIQSDLKPEPVYLRFFKSLRDTLFERSQMVTSTTAPTVNDIQPGEWRIWRDSSGPTVVLAVNDGGVIKTVTLT